MRGPEGSGPHLEGERRAERRSATPRARHNTSTTPIARGGAGDGRDKSAPTETDWPARRPRGTSESPLRENRKPQVNKWTAAPPTLV